MPFYFVVRVVFTKLLIFDFLLAPLFLWRTFFLTALSIKLKALLRLALTKKTLENCEKYKKDPNEDNKNLVKTSLNNAFSFIDKAVKKNVLHKNNGANKKSKINKFVKTTLIAK